MLAMTVWWFGDALNFSRDPCEFSRAMDPDLARDADDIGPIGVNANHTLRRPVTPSSLSLKTRDRTGSHLQLNLTLMYLLSRAGLALSSNNV
jgi:hypothetical protein